MSVKCKRNLVDGQKRIGRERLTTYTTCSTRRTGYEPPKHTSDKTLEVEPRDVTECTGGALKRIWRETSKSSEKPSNKGGLNHTLCAARISGK
jgi:hypothetical protein